MTLIAPARNARPRSEAVSRDTQRAAPMPRAGLTAGRFSARFLTWAGGLMIPVGLVLLVLGAVRLGGTGQDAGTLGFLFGGLGTLVAGVFLIAASQFMLAVFDLVRLQQEQALVARRMPVTAQVVRPAADGPVDLDYLDDEDDGEAAPAAAPAMPRLRARRN